MPRARSVTGVSLLELLIAMTIVALLLSMAVPAWRDHVRKARRVEAISTLLHAATRQELFRFSNHRYANGEELFLPPPAGLGIGNRQEIYSLKSQAGADSFLLTATVTPGGPQGDDEQCRQMSIDETGRRTAINRNGLETNAVCWLVR